MIIIKGRVDRRDEGETKLAAIEVAAFEAVPLLGEVRLRVDARVAAPAFIDELARLIREFPGEAGGGGGRRPTGRRACCASAPASRCGRRRTSSPRCGCSAARPSSSEPRSSRSGAAALAARAARDRARSRLRPAIRARCHNAGVSGSVLELDLDLDAFSGPFDLLLALVLREELELVEVPIVDVVLAYLARLEGAEELDLESLSEFLVLVAALCELKSRLLVDADAEDEEELDAESAAEELARASPSTSASSAPRSGSRERRAAAGLRVFRTGRRPTRRPRPAAPLVEEQPARLAEAMLHLLEPPARVDTTTIRRRAVADAAVRGAFPPARAWSRRVRVRRRGRGPRAGRAGGRVRGAARADQARRGARGPGRAVRADPRRPRRARRCASRRGSSTRRRPWRERGARRGLRGAAVRRRRAADGARARGRGRGRRGASRARSTSWSAVSPSAARASCSTAPAAATGLRAAPGRTGRGASRLQARAPERGLSPAALEALAVVAYLQPIGRPEIARIRGVSLGCRRRGPARAGADRGGRPRRRARHARAVPHDDDLRAHLRARGGPRRAFRHRRPATSSTAPTCASGCTRSPPSAAESRSG